MRRKRTRSAHYAASSWSYNNSAQEEVAKRHKAQRATNAAEWATSRQFFLSNLIFWGRIFGPLNCDTYVETHSAIEMAN
jgi:exopolysaccharide biosynthesis protein